VSRDFAEELLLRKPHARGRLLSWSEKRDHNCACINCATRSVSRLRPFLSKKTAPSLNEHGFTPESLWLVDGLELTNERTIIWQIPC